MAPFLVSLLLLVVSVLGGSPVAPPSNVSPWVPKNITYMKYRSPSVPLRSGQIANTPFNFGPLEMPKGKVAISYFYSDVVDDTGRSVPLSEVYVHHWLIYATTNHFHTLKYSEGPCNSLPMIFGIGAELRHSLYEYPEGYAVKTDGNETWTANLHFIRSTNVPDVQSCIECRCEDSDPPMHNHGEVGCCPDQGQCWGMKNSTLNDTKNYYLQYIVGFRELTDDLNNSTEEIDTFPFDITARNTYDCQTDFDIPELPSGVNQTNSSMAVSPFDIDVVVAATHVHIGGEYMGVEHYSANGTYIGLLCDATPTYGTELGVAGNELDYLVGIPYCTFTEKPYRVSKGDQIKLVTQYSGRTLPGGHHWHSGVMGIAVLYGVDKTVTTNNCIPKYNQLCNPPPYYSWHSCNKCYQRNALVLNSNGCNPQIIRNHCRQTDTAGNVPSPVTQLSLSLTPPDSSPPLTATLTGPVGVWFGIGWNKDYRRMSNATAWVVSDVGDGVLKLQKRILGNHAAGTIVDADVNSTITTMDQRVQVNFTLTADDLAAGSYNCFLFARGDILDGATFQYHGSHRGAVCDI